MLITGGNKMIKKEIVQKVAERTGQTNKKAKKTVEVFMEEIMAAVASGEKVSLVGFGGFESRERAEKKGTNPSNGEPMMIEKKIIPYFKPSQAFKDKVLKK